MSKAIETLKGLLEQANKVIMEAEQEERKEATERQEATGRPFMVGVNEPKEGQNVYYMEFSGTVSVSIYYNGIAWFNRSLLRGLLYPAEAECIEGEKRCEIEARYRAMGRPYVKNAKNWNACFDRMTRKVELYVSGYTDYGHVYFETEETCQSAIDTINREYGDHAFEHYILGVPWSVLRK